LVQNNFFLITLFFFKVITALNYPVAMLSRTMNNETPELLAYKNQPGKIIVLYDDDEKLTPRAAQTLVERGYDNMFMLSGGMKLASKKFPEGLITGILPQFYALPTPKENKSTRGSMTSMSNSSAFSNASDLNKKKFDKDDIERLNFYLEGSLMPHEQRFNSRMSSKSSRTMQDNVSVVSNKTMTSTTVWKP
jgi:centrosomal protein CEP41